MTNPISANDTQALVSKAVREKGLPAVCELTGLHRESLTRALAGLPVRRGTMALIRDALAPKPAALVSRLYQDTDRRVASAMAGACSPHQQQRPRGQAEGAEDYTMGQPKVATAAINGNHEEPATVHVHQHFQAARTRTGKQIAADLCIGKEHFYTWADGQGIAYVTIAKQRVYVMADVEEAIRRAGKIAPPVGKTKKTPPTPKMTALEIAAAAGISFVKGGAK